MLRAAIGFFIVGLLFYFLGAGGIAMISMELGKTLLWVFLILSVISLLVSLFGGRGRGIHLFVFFIAGATSLLLGLDHSQAVAGQDTEILNFDRSSRV